MLSIKQKEQLSIVLEQAITEAINKHLETYSLRTLDFMNASDKTTDFYIELESSNKAIA